MKTIILEAADAPLSAYSGHPRGVYGWDVPGPNLGQDSKLQRRLVTRCKVRMELKADKRKRRRVFTTDGLEIGVIRYGDTWFIHPHIPLIGGMRGSGENWNDCASQMSALL